MSRVKENMDETSHRRKENDSPQYIGIFLDYLIRHTFHSGFVRMVWKASRDEGLTQA